MHPAFHILPALVCSAAAYIVAELLTEQVAHGWRWHHALPVSVCLVAVAGAVVAALGVVS